MTVTRADITGIHQRLDRMAESLTAIAATCPDCRQSVKDHGGQIQSLQTDVAVIKSRAATSAAHTPSGKFAIWLPASAKPYIMAASILAGLVSAFFGGTLTGFYEDHQTAPSPPTSAQTHLDNSDSGG